MVIASYLIAGMFAGLVGGLLGVGGGIIVVPVLILVFESQGFSALVLTHMAIGTSLATIVFTSASSVLNHHRLGSVEWTIFKHMSIGIVAGAIAGVFVVTQLEGIWLRKMIGLFAVLMAGKMLVASASLSQRQLPASHVLASVGGVIGGISSMLGIGGGTLSVPFLSRYRLEMRQVIGTAAACGLPIAIAGALTNMSLGQGVEGRPNWSVGFVYLPALFGIAVTSVFFARIGTRLAHRLPAITLRRLFSTALLIVGIKFLAF